MKSTFRKRHFFFSGIGLPESVPVNKVVLLVAAAILLTFGVLSIPLVAIFDVQVYTQGLLFIVAPLTVAALCLSLFSVLLTVSLIKTAKVPRSGAKEDPHTHEDLPQIPHTPASSPSEPNVNAALVAADDFGLTRRETEVFTLLLQGRNAERISQTLVVSKHTAKSHIYNIYRKTGAGSQQELIDLFQQKLAG